MEYLLLSDDCNGQSIAVVKFERNIQFMNELFKQAIGEHFCCEVEIKKVQLPKDGNNGLIFYEDEFDKELREVSLEQIALY